MIQTLWSSKSTWCSTVGFWFPHKQTKQTNINLLAWEGSEGSWLEVMVILSVILWYYPWINRLMDKLLQRKLVIPLQHPKLSKSVQNTPLDILVRLWGVVHHKFAPVPGCPGNGVPSLVLLSTLAPWSRRGAWCLHCLKLAASRTRFFGGFYLKRGFWYIIQALVMKPLQLRHCWWKKSCPSWYVVYPNVFTVLYIPGGSISYINNITSWIDGRSRWLKL